MRISLLLLLLAGLPCPSSIQADSLATKPLVEIAARHQMPMPPEGARLVLANTGSSSMLSNQSTSRDPRIYSPAFLLEEKTNGGVIVLRGTERETLEPYQGEPLWRPFSTTHIEPKPGGHVVSFDRTSVFVCVVQLAARGDEAMAQEIWRRLSDDVQPWSDLNNDERLPSAVEQLKDPPLLLGRCLYGHFRSQLLQQPEAWPDIRARMVSLFDEFPALKNSRRNEVLEGLTAALETKAPATNSIEALLIDWSRRRSSKRDLGLFDKNDQAEADGPARAIVLQGADAVPALIALLNDRRITVHEAHGFNTFARIQRLDELAGLLLEAITGTAETFPSEAPDAAVFRAWLEKQRKLGEEEALAESVFTREGANITGMNETPVRILAQKYPDRLIDLCSEFSKRATPKAQPFNLAEALSTARLPKSLRVNTLAEFARRGSLEHRRCVLQVLAGLDDKKCAELLMPLLQKLPTDSNDAYWTCPEAGFSHVVMQIESDDIWRTYLRAAKRSSVGLRMEMMEPMDYSCCIGGKNRDRRLAFLSAFLDDKAVRKLSSDETKFDGPCAAFNIPKISVRDFAAGEIASILGLPDSPDEYWTSAQWSALRQKVREKLAAENLPSLVQTRNQ